MKVCFIAAEVAPFVKVGGLGDVIGSLPKALRELGIDARVVLPLYSSIDRERFGLKYRGYQFVDLGWRHLYKLFRLPLMEKYHMNVLDRVRCPGCCD